jgi:hypothetical protein
MENQTNESKWFFTQYVLRDVEEQIPLDLHQEMDRIRLVFDPGPDGGYVPFETKHLEKAYPNIARFLKSKGLDYCLIDLY